MAAGTGRDWQTVGSFLDGGFGWLAIFVYDMILCVYACMCIYIYIYVYIYIKKKIHVYGTMVMTTNVISFMISPIILQ